MRLPRLASKSPGAFLLMVGCVTLAMTSNLSCPMIATHCCYLSSKLVRNFHRDLEQMWSLLCCGVFCYSILY